MKNSKEEHFNLFREYVQAICQVDKSKMIRTAEDLLSEATGGYDLFEDNTESEIKLNVSAYLSKKRELAKPIAAKVLKLYDSQSFRMHLETICTDKSSEKLNSSTLQKLSTALKSFESLVDINEVEEDLIEEPQDGQTDSVILHAERLFVTMLTKIAGRKKSPEESKVSSGAYSENEQKMLLKHRNEVDDILIQLNEILNRMIAKSITEDLVNAYRSVLPADYVAHASDEELFGENSGVNVPLNERKLQNAAPKERADREETAEKKQNITVTIKKLFKEDTPENQSEFYISIEQDLSEFLAMNQKLDIYCKTYPNYVLLHELYQNGLELQPEMFLPDASALSRDPYSEAVNQYQKLLYQCRQSLTFNNPLVPSAP